MKYLFTTLISFFILAFSLQAQTGFEKVHGGDLPDWFRTVIATSDGGIIAGGGTKSFGFGDINNSDGYIVKMNTDGDTLWTFHFGEFPYNDEVYSIVENAAGYLAAGWNVTDTPTLSYEFYAVQLDVNGNQVWESFYGTPGFVYCNDVMVDNHGRNVLCGAAYSGITNHDFYLVKTNAAGIKIDEAYLGSAGLDWPNAIIQTADGGYAIVGYTSGGTPGFNIYLMKTDSNLNFLWSRNYGDLYDDYGYDLAEDAGGNLWILGAIQSLDTNRMVLIETDASGDSTTIKYPGITFGDYGYQVQTLSGGGFLLAGFTGVLGKGNEMLVEKLDASGDTVWTKHLGGTQNESGLAVAIDGAGNILLAGETEGFGVDQFDAYIVKLDAVGEIPCPPSLSFVTNPVSLCEDENAFFTNTTVSSQQFTWSEGGNDFSNSTDAARYFSSAGNYDVTLSACTVSLLQNITVNAKPASHFSYTHSGATVNFTLDAGITVQSISWNFGDGTPLNTTENNPSHTYANPGFYWVIVSVTNTSGCDSTYIEQINLPVGIEEVNENSFSLFPNPAHEWVTLKTSSMDIFPLKITTMNVQGKILNELMMTHDQQAIFINDLLPGIYFLKLQEQSGNPAVMKLEVY